MRTRNAQILSELSFIEPGISWRDSILIVIQFHSNWLLWEAVNFSLILAIKICFLGTFLPQLQPVVLYILNLFLIPFVRIMSPLQIWERCYFLTRKNRPIYDLSFQNPSDWFQCWWRGFQCGESFIQISSHFIAQSWEKEPYLLDIRKEQKKFSGIRD